MRYRFVEQSERFQAKAEEIGAAFPQFDQILETAILFLEGKQILEDCSVIGGGATELLYCLPSMRTKFHPAFNFYFSFASRSNQNDTVILYDAFVG